MSDRYLLSPLGAVAERLRAARVLAESTRPALPAFPARLVQGLAAHDQDETVLELAWELARCVDGLTAVEGEALMALAAALLVALARGSTRLPIAGADAASFTRPLLDALGGAGAAARALALVGDPRLAAILRRGDTPPPPGLERPLLVAGDHLYAQRLAVLEARVVAALRARLAAAGPVAVDDAPARAALGDVLAHPVLAGGRPVILSDDQQQAVLGAAHRRFVVITGGPGTGKTSIVVALLRVLLRLGVAPEAIAMATPTGKAAHRMRESIEGAMKSLAARPGADAAVDAIEPPRTLHRLLGYSPGLDRFRRDDRSPLDEEVVIVDECSMIDVAMMDRLLRAVRPAARLILLGDAEQLPSVEAGVVFRELVPPAGAGDDDPRRRSAVRLRHSYRMDVANPAGRNLYLVAREINEGRADALVAAPGAADETRFAARAALAELRGEGAELFETAGPADVGAFLDHWFRARVAALDAFETRLRHAHRKGAAGFVDADRAALEILFAHYEGHRVLCVTRGPGGATSAEAANRHLRARLRQLLGASGPAEYEPGDPVMVGRNDYQRGLYNGDQGLVLWVAGEDGHSRPMAVFRRGADFSAFDVRSLRGELSPSYAITVHKAQGSELDHVALLLPEAPVDLCTRELVYTAVTRARTSAVVVGSRATLAAAVRRRVERWSGVGEGLAEGASPAVSART